MIIIKLYPEVRSSAVQGTFLVGERKLEDAVRECDTHPTEIAVAIHFCLLKYNASQKR